MTPYERGYAAALKAAAEVCENRALELFDAYKRGNSPHRANPHTEGMADAFDDAAQRILSLPIVGEATNPGEQVQSIGAVRIEETRQPTLPTPARPGPSHECVMVPPAAFEEWWDRRGRAIYQSGGRDPKALAALSWESAMLAAREE